MHDRRDDKRQAHEQSGDDQQILRPILPANSRHHAHAQQHQHADRIDGVTLRHCGLRRTFRARQAAIFPVVEKRQQRLVVGRRHARKFLGARRVGAVAERGLGEDIKPVLVKFHRAVRAERNGRQHGERQHQPANDARRHQPAATPERIEQQEWRKKFHRRRKSQAEARAEFPSDVDQIKPARDSRQHQHIHLPARQISAERTRTHEQRQSSQPPPAPSRSRFVGRRSFQPRVFQNAGQRVRGENNQPHADDVPHGHDPEEPEVLLVQSVILAARVSAIAPRRVVARARYAGRKQRDGRGLRMRQRCE